MIACPSELECDCMIKETYTWLICVQSLQATKQCGRWKLATPFLTVITRVVRPGWSGQGGQARVVRPGWSGQGGQARVVRPGWSGQVRPGWSGQGGQARVVRPGWSGQGGQARVVRPGWSGQGGQARVVRPGWSGQQKENVTAFAAKICLRLNFEQTCMQ